MLRNKPLWESMTPSARRVFEAFKQAQAHIAEPAPQPALTPRELRHESTNLNDYWAKAFALVEK